MFKPIIRLLSFFSKEVNEVRRQPKLVLSLLLGPFIILLLFGIGYSGERPKIRTVLVMPPQGLDLVDINDLKKAISTNFALVDVTSDQNAAQALLRSGQADVVETLPPDAEQQLTNGQQATITFSYNEISPLNEQWIQYLAYAQVNEINRAVQTTVVQQFQKEASTAGVRTSIPPEVLVSPVRFEYKNARGQALNFMTLFRVAPVSMNQLLFGKYLGFTMFIGIIFAALTALLVLTPLAVPFYGSAWMFVAFALLFTLASLGIGFLISAWVTSDSQAVQLSMLVLLMSIFFSGFFLPLENFTPEVRWVGYALPLTHAISGFQRIMLRGQPPTDIGWAMLGLIAVLAFIFVSLLARWRFRQLD